MTTFKVALIQERCSPNYGENIESRKALIRKAALGSSAQVIALSELFTAPYFCTTETHAYFDLAEPQPFRTVEHLSPLAKELGVVLVVPFYERRAPGVYHNSTAVIDADGSLCGIYRKMHIPDDPLYYEKFYFTPADAEGLQNQIRKRGSADLLGSVVSGRGKNHFPHGGRHYLLPDRHRLASWREGRVW